MLNIYAVNKHAAQGGLSDTVPCSSTDVTNSISVVIVSSDYGFREQ